MTRYPIHVRVIGRPVRLAKLAQDIEINDTLFIGPIFESSRAFFCDPIWIQGLRFKRFYEIHFAAFLYPQLLLKSANWEKFSLFGLLL